MTKEEIETLAQKVFKGEATPEELDMFTNEFTKLLSEVEESATSIAAA